MIPLPDACHGPRFFFFFTLFSSTIRVLCRPQQIFVKAPNEDVSDFPGLLAACALVGILGLSILKDCFSKGLVFLPEGWKQGKDSVSDACFKSPVFFRGILSSHHYFLLPKWADVESVTMHHYSSDTGNEILSHKESMSSFSFRMGKKIYILTNYQPLVQYISLSLNNVSKFEQTVPNFKVTEQELESRTESRTNSRKKHC